MSVSGSIVDGSGVIYFAKRSNHSLCFMATVMLGSIEPLAVILLMAVIGCAVCDTRCHRVPVDTLECDRCGAVRACDPSEPCHACVRLLETRAHAN